MIDVKPNYKDGVSMPATSVSIWMALGGGLLFFLNPCVWPLYPAYVSYITGSSLSELQSGDKKENFLKNIKNTLGFIVGFSIIFMVLGAVATSLGSYYANQQLFERIAGVIIIFFGLQLSGLLKFSFLSADKRVSFLPDKPGFLSSTVFGATFALGWTPCATPILGAILAYAFTQETLYQGILLLGAFSIGFGIPFLILTALLSLVENAASNMGKIGRHLPTINKVSGYVLLLVGVLLFFNLMSEISLWLYNLAG